MIYEEEFTPSKDDDAESVINALDGWAFSNYIIENKEEFRMMLRGVLEDDELETDSYDHEEVELLTIIEEYQDAGRLKAVCSQTNHLVEHYVKKERFDIALEKVDGNISQLISMDIEDEEVKWFLFIARVLKGEILLDNNNAEDSRKEIEKAFEVILDDIALWKLGSKTGTRRRYYERGLKLRSSL